MNISILTPDTGRKLMSMKRLPDVKRGILNTRRYILTTVMLLIFSTMYAQQFSVQSFRQLPNDISAYIQPVKDLNDEACALIKIVGSRDFAFSTPLGIVKRKNDIGETWIYVPRSTTQITIKHPQWGVLRDYRFPSPLESRLTYELVLSAPSVSIPRRKIPLIENTAVSDPHTYELTIQQLPVPEWRCPRRPKEKAAWLIMPSIGLHRQEAAGGIRLAWMRRHGIYLHALSDFRTTPDTNGQECDKNGLLPGSALPPYYSGRSEKSYYALTAGGIHRIVGNFCLYEGIGYGARTVVWQTDEGTYLRNSDYSSQGLTAEAGAMLRLRRFAFSVGAITTGGKYWMMNLGLGIRL
ncbi:hypothetical protein [Bacteroides caecimuris]|uniref:hypothetical protein n=2 Tax=Bacteroides caecimuris TaxID=1796613 RepID=UPI0026483759|nr:hypothetical protein [Bacteroides caecimuris]